MTTKQPHWAVPLAASTALYVALTAVMGRHVLASLGSAIASDPGDPVLNAAILAWNAAHVPWTDAWYQFPIFHPTPDALTLSEHLLGVSAIATPILWMTGDAAIAYNLTLLLSYPLCGVTMYLLVWRLTRHPAAAFLAGLAYAFAPYRASQLPHIQVLAGFWAPLALIGLHGFLDVSRRKGRLPASAVPRQGSPVRAGRTRPAAGWLALFAIGWLMQGAANGYFLVFFSIVVALWVVWFLALRRRWSDAGLVAGAAALAALPLVPILYRYFTAHRALGLSRTIGEIASYSADIAAPLCAAPSLTVWGWLRVACGQEGELFAGAGLAALCGAGVVAALRQRTPAPAPAAGVHVAREHAGAAPVQHRSLRLVRRAALGVAAVYAVIAASILIAGPWRLDLGWARASASSADKPASVVALLLLVALVSSPRFLAWVRRGSTRSFYLAAAIVCWVLTWGPFPRLFGVEVLYQAPFAWLLQVPGVGGLRVPARFWMLAVLCLAVFLGLSMADALRRRRRAPILVTVLAAVALVLDGWMTIPAAPFLGAVPDLDQQRGRTVLVLPAGDLERDLGAVYAAVGSGVRLVNGYSGYEPSHYEALRALSRRGDGVLFEPFVRADDLDVIVDAADAAARALVAQQADAVAVAPGGMRVAYRIPRRPSAQARRPPLGPSLGIAALEASCSAEGAALAGDRDVSTRWVCGVQDAGQQITADLGGTEEVAAIVLAMGPFGADFPRHLVIETSQDGTSWARAWEGSPAAAVLAAALESPRLTRAELPFTPRRARFVRLRQTERHERSYWSIGEMEIRATSNFEVQSTK